MGGHNWNPMSYNPRTGLVYLPTLRAANFMLDNVKGHEYHPGRLNMGITGDVCQRPAARLSQPHAGTDATAR
jgi:hypothetical protein